MTPENYWKELVEVSSRIGKIEKFTNNFKYYEYKIVQSINKDNAEVRFIPKKQNNKKILYSLELKKNRWIIVDIKYDIILENSKK